MWQALGSPGQHRGASEGRALGPKSLRLTNGKGKGAYFGKETYSAISAAGHLSTSVFTGIRLPKTCLRGCVRYLV